MMTFYQKLNTISLKNNSLVCVGLDSDLSKIPQHLQKTENPQFEFSRAIIDTTHDLVCAYKPNSAFYEAQGSKGIRELEMTIGYIKRYYPDIVIIFDGKRADIGSTNQGYVEYIFNRLDADAVTLHPYPGREALKPFLDREDKGLFVWCRTSNPGAGEFQDLIIDNKPLYQIVADNVAKNWNTKRNCGLIVGATYPEELHIVRQIAPDMPILIPGVGAQGADVQKTIEAGIDKEGLNAIINSSRGIIFASQNLDFADKARQETIKLKDLTNQYRRNQ